MIEFKKFGGIIQLNNIEVEFLFIPIVSSVSTVLTYRVHTIKPESMFQMINYTQMGYKFSFKNASQLPNWLENDANTLKKLNDFIVKNEKINEK
ncbi:MAG: hypothetical protein SFY56_16010 [Bacteroidota bacterium]|nr:hypothetical protein [Bacteroidota bacterium]